LNGSTFAPQEAKYCFTVTRSFPTCFSLQEHWPKEGRHILANYDQDTIIVYQAYKPEIGHYVAEHKKFDGAPGFDTKRMTWIKTNFLWMMFRSGWGHKKDQQVTLAIRLKREAFERYLANTVHTSMNTRVYKSKHEWQDAMSECRVRLQWDPDHHPSGAKNSNRKAIQLGLKEIHTFVNGKDIVDVYDISNFVRECTPTDTSSLSTPYAGDSCPSFQLLAHQIGLYA
jgi:hypothetical protein